MNLQESTESPIILEVVKLLMAKRTFSFSIHINTTKYVLVHTYYCIPSILVCYVMLPIDVDLVLLSSDTTDNS